MQSFRTEIENPIVEKDILELERKIHQFKNGLVPDDKFRSLRLARGVYGQRQQGVQMIRIKIPYGKLSFRQLLRIADVCDTYSTGNLHMTTRQDIQIHYVSLDDTPQLWAELEKDEVTLREACGNTVRNITASAIAGIDPDEPFDVGPYAQAVFQYFLRNPVCQDMGRKFKMAFSSSDADSAYAQFHDLGFIPKIKHGQHGFRVLLGGGLGAQPHLAEVLYDFLPIDQVIPVTESVIRAFDRHGERANRNKARFKFLLKKEGLDTIKELIALETAALPFTSFPIAYVESPVQTPHVSEAPIVLTDDKNFTLWRQTNVHAQKQAGLFSVAIKLTTGDVSTAVARQLVDVAKQYAANDIRVTVDQNLLLRHVQGAYIPNLYVKLKEINLAAAGYGTFADITACPGTDTCNLGISNSTGVARLLESHILNTYPHLVYNDKLDIKISGCMNACGQHLAASIGFHGSSMKVGKRIMPALQVMLGGGFITQGDFRIADKVIKVPSKRVIPTVDVLVADYEESKNREETFNAYYHRINAADNKYFYSLLKDIANTEDVIDTEFVDWDKDEYFLPAIGIGECAGVAIDLVKTLYFEAEERVEIALDNLKEGKLSDAVYHAYTAFVQTAKAYLVGKEVKTNSQEKILTDFSEQFGTEYTSFYPNTDFKTWVLRAKSDKVTETFAAQYVAQAQTFFKTLSSAHDKVLEDKEDGGN